MAFYHNDGLPSAWNQAMKFAGKGGRIATMPDIVAARLETKPDDEPWNTWYTTLTAEYFGYNKGGKPVLIIAHGVGPMSTLEGVQRAYSWEYKDKDRSRRGGRITAQEFLDLEAGKFGDVSVIDITDYCKRYKYSFLQMLRFSEALTDPVLKARLGPESNAYILAHANHARAWHREQFGFDPEDNLGQSDISRQLYLSRRANQHLKDGAGPDSDPYILGVEGPSNCHYGSPEYGFRKIEDGLAIAHLISTGRLSHTNHEGNESLVLDVGCHEWWNATRLVGIQSGGNIRSGLHRGPDAYNLLRKHWPELLIPMKEPEEVGFRALVNIGGGKIFGSQWFTQYPKQGESMDTWEPEYLVTKLEKVGKPVQFRTEVGGYHGFFKFGVNEVQAIAPMGANAYSFIGDPVNEWIEGNPTHQIIMVQFYNITADSTKRMMRSCQLERDYETLMKLVKKESERPLLSFA